MASFARQEAHPCLHEARFPCLCARRPGTIAALRFRVNFPHTLHNARLAPRIFWLHAAAVWWPQRRLSPPSCPLPACCAEHGNAPTKVDVAHCTHMFLLPPCRAHPWQRLKDKVKDSMAAFGCAGCSSPTLCCSSTSAAPPRSTSGRPSFSTFWCCSAQARHPAATW